MCKTGLHNFLKALPKCEHHVHIEGTLSPTLLFELAQANKISLPQDDPAFGSPQELATRYTRFTSLDDFLHYYYIGMSALQTQRDYELLARRYFERASRDGVVHAEVFFDPQAHLTRGVPLHTMLAGFEQARTFALQELGMSTELICCFLRHLPAKDCLTAYQAADLQEALASGIVRGIGLDSSESDRPPELFTSLYESAERSGFKRTAHAGEEGPAGNIATALDLLHVQRIDHGVRLVEDIDLMARVARDEIMLTLCPLSNVFLRVVPSVAHLPVLQFLKAGLQFSINSDDPAYFGDHYILDNYCAVQDAFDLSIEQWELICSNSIKGSWCHEARKTEIRSLLSQVLASWHHSKQ